MPPTNAPSSRIAVTAAVLAGCLALIIYQSRRIAGETSPPSTPGSSTGKKRKKKKKRTKKRKSSVSSDPIDPSSFHFPPRAKCPLCKVILPLKQSQKTFLLCCGTEICRACNAEAYAEGIPTKRESKSKRDDEIDEIEEIEVDEDETKEQMALCCVLCNAEAPAGVENILTLLQQRIEEDQDPNAMHVLSGLYWDENGVENNPQKALELCTRAAEADHAEACHELALIYCEGKYGITQDTDKGKMLLFKAARLGSAVSLNALGGLMIQEGNLQLGTRYWLLGASNGEEYSLHNVKKAFEGKVVNKEDYASALRAYQNAHGETRSPKRDKMEKDLAAMAKGS